MGKIILSNSTGLLPLAIAMITVADSEGHIDISTINHLSVLCMDPMYIGIGLTPNSSAHRIIENNPEFVVNSVGEDLLYEADLLKNDKETPADKFELTRLTPQPAKYVRPPSVLESAFNAECRVQDVIKLGAEDFYIGKVLISYIEEAALANVGEVEEIDTEASRAVVEVAGVYWALGHKIEAPKRMAA